MWRVLGHVCSIFHVPAQEPDEKIYIFLYEHNTYQVTPWLRTWVTKVLLWHVSCGSDKTIRYCATTCLRTCGYMVLNDSTHLMSEDLRTFFSPHPFFSDHSSFFKSSNCFLKDSASAKSGCSARCNFITWRMHRTRLVLRLVNSFQDDDFDPWLGYLVDQKFLDGWRFTVHPTTGGSLVR